MSCFEPEGTPRGKCFWLLTARPFFRAMWNMYKPAALLFISAAVLGVQASEVADTNVTSGTQFKLERPPANLWDGGVGQGFRSTTKTLTLEAGAVNGIVMFGGKQAHDLALTSLSYGHMLGHTVGKSHFYEGNWELRGELFGGVEWSPSSEWVIGIAPHLRYNFVTGTRFVPFIDAGAGVTATSIGPPDLSNIFEFNLKGTIGTQVFLRDNLALTIDASLLHMSCAGISRPNLGLNGVMGMIGLTFLF